MATTFFPLPPAPTAWPETAILTGHLAFWATPAQARQATSLARWRTHLTAAAPENFKALVALTHCPSACTQAGFLFLPPKEIGRWSRWSIHTPC